MIYFKELDLPAPVVSNEILDKIYQIKHIDNKYETIIRDIDQYLNPELLDKCKSVGVTPYFFAAFGRGNVGMSSIHGDISFSRNRTWVGLPIGINWELTPGETTWSWWDTGDEPALYPPLSKASFLQGINFKHRGNKDTNGFTQLCSYDVKINQAVIYRSDIAHQVRFNTKEDYRKCISVRFSPSDIPTWERALEIFRPFFIEQH